MHLSSDVLVRNAHEVIETFWTNWLPQKAVEKKQTFLTLFSEEQVLGELAKLKDFSPTPDSTKGNTGGIHALSVNLPLRYAAQTIVQQSFSIIPHGNDNIFDWDDKQMSQAFENAVSIIHDIPKISDQTADLKFLHMACQWEHACAYYLAFFWFTTVGPQLASTVVSRIKLGSPLLRFQTSNPIVSWLSP